MLLYERAEVYLVEQNKHLGGRAGALEIDVFRWDTGLSWCPMLDAVGVSRQTIISIEKGRYDPSLPLAFQLAREFNCTIEDLFIYEAD